MVGIINFSILYHSTFSVDMIIMHHVNYYNYRMQLQFNYKINVVVPQYNYTCTSIHYNNRCEYCIKLKDDYDVQYGITEWKLM